MERLEVEGPATLLYGSNVIGGVVNAITPHDTLFASRPSGGRGQVFTGFSSANKQSGANGNVQFHQNNCSVWAGGGARRTDDYNTPERKVENSKTRLSNARGGFGYFGGKIYFSAGYQIDDGRYGIPGAGEFHAHVHEEQHEGEENGHEEEFQIGLDTFRQSARFDISMRALLKLDVGYVDVELTDIPVSPFLGFLPYTGGSRWRSPMAVSP